MTESEPPTPSPQELKVALKAFRKRLKLTRLDWESKISASPLTHPGGKIVAVVPPNQFSQSIWDELVKQGKLKKAGHGTYELVDE